MARTKRAPGNGIITQLCKQYSVPPDALQVFRDVHRNDRPEFGAEFRDACVSRQHGMKRLPHYDFFVALLYLLDKQATNVTVDKLFFQESLEDYQREQRLYDE